MMKKYYDSLFYVSRFIIHLVGEKELSNELVSRDLQYEKRHHTKHINEQLFSHFFTRWISNNDIKIITRRSWQSTQRDTKKVHFFRHAVRVRYDPALEWKYEREKSPRVLVTISIVIIFCCCCFSLPQITAHYAAKGNSANEHTKWRGEWGDEKILEKE